jgi:phage terminase small subunit
MTQSPKKASSARCDAAGLALRERLFVAEYIMNGGIGAQAAMAAGYRGDHRARACRLLKRPKIAEAVRTLADSKLSELDVRVGRVLTEVVRIAFADPRRAFTEGNKPVPIRELDNDTARSISQVEIRSDRIRYKFHPKTPALQLLAAHLQLFDRPSADKKDRLAEVVAAFQNPPEGSKAG